MTYHDDAYEDAYYADEQERARHADDYAAWLAQVEQEPPPNCPYCGRPVDVISNGALICAYSGAIFSSIDELESDRAELARLVWAQ